MENQKIKSFYDRNALAAPWESAGILDSGTLGEALLRDRLERRTLQRLLPPLPPGPLLELGCGNGRWLEFFHTPDRPCFGMDLSWEILQHAQKRVRERALTEVRLFQGDAANLPLRGEFSLLYCSSLILYLSDREAESLLRSLFTILPPGGVLLCRDSLSLGERFLSQGEYPATYRSLEEFQALVEAQGFRFLRSQRSYTPFARAYLLQRFLPLRLLRLLPLPLLSLLNLVLDLPLRVLHPRVHPPSSTQHLFLVYEKS